MIKLLTGWRGYLAVASLAGVAASGAAWVAQHWRYEARIAVIQRGQAERQSTAAHAALNQLTADINAVAAAGRRAAAVGPALVAEINKLTGALKDATPLPADCRPDSVRVRSLADSVRAANRAAAGQPISGAVSADP